MISVGRWDGSKSLELEFGMEETEVEEGEACSNRDRDRDSSIDPDVAFSYIGEKLQKYLGHHQKDFEGGVSAENLGAKFGGYGSFLPTYQRTPSWSQAKSPAVVHDYNLARSPTKLNPELQDQGQSPFASCRESPSARSCDASGKAVPVGLPLKSKGYVQSNHVEEPTTKSEAIKKPVNPSKQRTLKVRIKLGSEDLSSQKNAELYSGLGLVVSPSSSLENSPAVNVEIGGNRLHAPHESPTSILEIMTSYPGELLLSPLPEDLICVECENEHVDNKMAMEMLALLENGFHCSKSNQKVVELKMLKSSVKDNSSTMELTAARNNGDKDNGASLQKKGIDIDMTEELPAKDVPTSLTLPLNAQKVRVKAETLSAEEDGKFEKLGGRAFLLARGSESNSRNIESDIASESIDRSIGILRDTEIENEGNESVLGEMASLGGVKDSHNLEKRSLSEDCDILKGDYDGKNSELPIRTETHPRLDSPLNSPLGLKPSIEAPPGAVPVVEEFWVSCDKCQKWRLLPPGTDPKSLPRKWICRMLTWLSEMNRCSIPENETTNASRILYNSAAAATSSKIVPVDVNQNTAVQTGVISGTKVNSADLDGPTHSSNSETKVLAGSEKASNSSNENCTPNACGNKWASAVLGYNDAEEEKISLPKTFGKDVKTKKRNKQETDLEGSRAFKRIKSGELHSDGENWNSDNEKISSRKATSSFSNNNASGSDRHKYTKNRDFNGAAKKSTVSCSIVEKHVSGAQNDYLLHLGKHGKEFVRKRKGKDPNNSLIHSEPISSLGQHHPDSVDLVDDFSKREAKKVRLSDCGGKDPSGSKTSVTTYRKSKETKDQHTAQCLGNSQVADCTISDMGSVRSLVAVKDTAGYDMEKANNKVSGSHEKVNGGRRESDEKSGIRTKSEKFVSLKDSSRTLSEDDRGQGQKKLGGDRQEAHGQDKKQHNHRNEHGNDKLPKKINQAEVYPSGMSNSRPPLARGQSETLANPQPVAVSQKENGAKAVAIDDSDTLKSQNRKKRAENQSSQPKRHPIPNSHKIRDVEAPSPLRRDSSSHAANNALKEARDLKHLADRMKNSGSTEGNGLYFQAALKFLHGASLLESGSIEYTQHNELMHTMQLYSSTAKLCEFCAREYEKSKEMAAAALAYKCMEVAYLRVIYSSHTRASRDWTELHGALQVAPSGESPSSSASDVDNLNQQVTADKAPLAKAVGSPQVSGTHVITSKSRPGCLRILNYVQDVNFAMEASRKSRVALAAATSRLEERSHSDATISSLNKAIDFSFHDVGSLLRVIRVAMEAIGR